MTKAQHKNTGAVKEENIPLEAFPSAAPYVFFVKYSKANQSCRTKIPSAAPLSACVVP